MLASRRYTQQVGNHCVKISHVPLLHSTFCLLIGGDEEEDDEEEVDSNNDAGSLQSERTDKDEEAGEGKPQALSRHPQVDLLTANCGLKYWKLHLVMKVQARNHWVCSLEKVTLSGTMRETFQL